MTLAAIQVDAGYGRTPVLRSVSCSITRGRVTALVGPNGAGKSTLLRVLIGAIPPRAGRVELDGAPVSRLSVRERASRMALVPQSTTPGTPYSVAQTVRLGRLAFHEPSARLRQITRAALERLELLDRADEPLGSLSAGQQQRALLARALAQLGLVGEAPATSGERPGRFLLADEPVASMDPRHALLAMDVLKEAAAAGAGVLVVVHDFALASRFADDAIVLDASGEVRATGPTAEVLRPAVLDAVFASTFAMVGPLDGGGSFPHPVAGHGAATTHTLGSA